MEDVRGRTTTEHHQLLEAVRRMHEANPMMGLRGVRLGLVLPGLYALQVRAVAEATADRLAAGGDPQPRSWFRWSRRVTELDRCATRPCESSRRWRTSAESDLEIPIGTMIELPRAALTAGEIAQAADFFSFGTNDLTQTTWGFSRDDVEGAFFTDYLEAGIFSVSPFESIDEEGVGALVAMASQTGGRPSREMSLGVCGEHGGDPASIHFFDRLRARLRLVFTLPRADRPAGGWAGRVVGRRQRQPLTTVDRRAQQRAAPSVRRRRRRTDRR